ncbi:hypothetical protein [Sporisorium scitamineum]|uniref:Uncharacterized protein n=1 Tax=Sporisorium scitamineum TaxID=49012 RepID=A0A0F7SAC9_9BASI|nr:hypothetical protein [Sporisorium scitamineum]
MALPDGCNITIRVAGCNGPWPIVLGHAACELVGVTGEGPCGSPPIQSEAI